MQKKQIFQLVLLAVGAVLAAVIGFWLVPVSNYIKARTAPLDETILEAESSTREVVTISDTELSQLISGELTLDALADLPGVITVEPAGAKADAAQSGGAANRSPADEASASAIAESEASSDAASREAQADAETPRAVLPPAALALPAMPTSRRPPMRAKSRHWSSSSMP